MRNARFFAFVVIALTGIAVADQVVEEIVARVNESIITRSELQREHASLQQEMQQAGATAEQVTARQNDVLRDLIDEHLMLDRAKELGLNADNEVVKRLSQMMQESGVTTMEELEKLAEQSGVTHEEFK